MSKNCCHSSGRPTDRLLDAARRNRRGTRNAKRVTGRGGYIFHSPFYLSSACEAQELRCSEILGSLAPCSIHHKPPSKPQSDECRRASQNFAGDAHFSGSLHCCTCCFSPVRMQTKLPQSDEIAKHSCWDARNLHKLTQPRSHYIFRARIVLS